MIKLYRKIIKSPTATTWLSYLSKSFNLLIVLPLLLKKIPANDVSLWYLFMNVMSIQILLEIGFSNTFVRLISYGFAGKEDMINQQTDFKNNDSDLNIDNVYIECVNYVMKKVYLYLSLGIFIFFLTIGFWLFFIPIQSASNPFNGWLVWVELILIVPIISYGGIYSNFLQGINKIAQLRIWETIFNLFSSITSIIILFFFPSIYLLVTSILFWSLLSICRNIYIKSKLNVKGEIDFSLVQKIKKSSLNNSLKSGFGVIFSQGITYAIGFYYAFYLNASELAAYLLAVNLILNIKNFSQAPFYSKIPLLNMLSSTGNFISMASISQRSMRLVYIVFITFAVLIWIIGHYYSRQIHVENKFPDIKLWGLLCFGFFIERFGAMHIQLYSTSNHILWHIHNGYTGLITIVITIILFNYIKIYSYPIGLIAGNLLFYSWYGPYHSYKLLGTRFIDFEKYTFIPFLFVAIVMLFLIFIA